MMNRLSSVFNRCVAFFTRKRCRVDVAPIFQTTEPTGTTFQYNHSSLLSTVHTKLPKDMQKSKEILIELQEQGFISKKGGISFRVGISELTKPRQTDFDNFTASHFKAPPRRLPKLDNIKDNLEIKTNKAIKKTKKTKKAKKSKRLIKEKKIELSLDERAAIMNRMKMI